MKMSENNIYSNVCSDSEEIIEFDPSKFVSMGQYRMMNFTLGKLRKTEPEKAERIIKKYGFKEKKTNKNS